jgi:hypothetical protein
MTKEEREKQILATRAAVANIDKEIQDTAGSYKEARGATIGAKTRQGELSAQQSRLKAQALEVGAGQMEERAGAAAGNARSLGGQNVYDRQFGLQAFKALQQFGPDALPPEMLQAAQQFAPNTAGKILETHGAGTAEFAEGMKVAPADFAGKPEDLRQKAEDLRQQAEQARAEAERTITRTAADAGRDFGVFLKDVINTMFDAMRRGVNNDLLLQRAGA